jgi:hypothetical protein
VSVKLCAAAVQALTVSQHSASPHQESNAAADQLAAITQLAFHALNGVALLEDNPRKLWDAVVGTLLLPALPIAFGATEEASDEGESGVRHAVQAALSSALLSHAHLQAIANEFHLAEAQSRPLHSGAATGGGRDSGLGNTYGTQLLWPWQAAAQACGAAGDGGAQATAGASKKRKRDHHQGASHMLAAYKPGTGLPGYAAWLLRKFSEQWQLLAQQQHNASAAELEAPGGPDLGSRVRAPFGLLQGLLAACQALWSAAAPRYDAPVRNVEVVRAADAKAQPESGATECWCVGAETCAELLHTATATRVRSEHMQAWNLYVQIMTSTRLPQSVMTRAVTARCMTRPASAWPRRTGMLQGSLVSVRTQCRRIAQAMIQAITS